MVSWVRSSHAGGVSSILVIARSVPDHHDQCRGIYRRTQPAPPSSLSGGSPQRFSAGRPPGVIRRTGPKTVWRLRHRRRPTPRSVGRRRADGHAACERPRSSHPSGNHNRLECAGDPLSPVRDAAVLRARQLPDLRDVFLCHAWDDRRGAAKELCDLLEAEGVSVWFSEKDIVLGQPFMREIDKGLSRSRTGLVLVTLTCEVPT
ncbi:toll/interleukin-1 receptor domain-containing protein [Streptomyces sp. NPDC047079]|uniref:toll/interleukin-1 receptor domain-containing protein n=1 Tax=Streptomyces sp. NPDC047079 TaxID=3154607 RepID=UPI0033FFCC1F